MNKIKHSLLVPRAVLLVEVERRCRVDGECTARTRIGLTKAEARAYCGFSCERCARWNEDVLTERDVPEWWEELAITGLKSLRELRPPAPDEPGAVIARLSDNYQLEVRGQKPEVDKKKDHASDR